MESQAGYTLQSGEPVIVENLKREKRFSGPAILHEHGVLSGISVVISAENGPWGVLGVHSRLERSFAADEVTFVQSVANVISSTILQEEADNLQKLLLAELRHRVKNTLATVQAIASLSFRGGEARDGAVEAFEMRIQALAETHDLLFQANWREIELSELVDRQLRPFGSERERVTARGPSNILLDAANAVSLGMVLHELLTNACKYGALSNDTGRVEVNWTTPSTAGEDAVDLMWREIGGPPVSPPQHEGIGTGVIRDSLDGPDTDLDYRFDAAQPRHWEA